MGALEGYFAARRGLRQGDPLSPYLFVLCMEVFTQLLDKSVRESKISYHPRCEKIGLTHLCFGNDLMVFAGATRHSFLGIKEVMEVFNRMSGLKVSFTKSEVFCCAIPVIEQRSLASLLGVKLGTLPVRYLGVPLISGKLKV